MGGWGLQSHNVLNGRPVTELVYVHSKMIIVDDKVCVCEGVVGSCGVVVSCLVSWPTTCGDLDLRCEDVLNGSSGTKLVLYVYSKMVIVDVVIVIVTCGCWKSGL